MNKYKHQIKKLPKSEIELEVELESKLLDEKRPIATKNIGQRIEVKGFRKGNAPENIVAEHVGEQKIIEEIANILIDEYFPKIIIEEKLDIIGRPQIVIKKLAFGNPMEFSAKFAIFPQFNLPDYKKIAKETNIKNKNGGGDSTATEKEVSDILLQIRKNKAHTDFHKANPNDTGHNHPDFEKEENLPPLNDELAKASGNFETLDALREQIKNNVTKEKQAREIDKKRVSIIENVLADTKIDLPEILIESELDKSIAQIKDDVIRNKAKFEDYLNHIKKSETDLRNELRENAKNKAKTQILFNKIAETEKLEPNKEILEAEIKNILNIYKEAKEENVRIYVSTMLLNQEVLKLLELQ